MRLLYKRSDDDVSRGWFLNLPSFDTTAPFSAAMFENSTTRSWVEAGSNPAGVLAKHPPTAATRTATDRDETIVVIEVENGIISK